MTQSVMYYKLIMSTPITRHDFPNSLARPLDLGA